MGHKLNKPYTREERIAFLEAYNYKLHLIIIETDEAIYALETNEMLNENGEIVINQNYEEEQKQKEHERIQELFMTRSDFFDGTIDAWGIGEDELLLVIQQLLGSLPFANNTKLKALNNFKNALNFYRKHTLFNLLVGQPIPLTENIQITLTDEALDKYFDEVNKGNKDTAWQYLPQPVSVPLPDHVEENLEVVEPEPDAEV
jgi:hypothetical protein